MTSLPTRLIYKTWLEVIDYRCIIINYYSDKSQLISCMENTPKTKCRIQGNNYFIKKENYKKMATV